jgi:hypothetical protein
VVLNPGYFAYNLTVLFPLTCIFCGYQIVLMLKPWKQYRSAYQFLMVSCLIGLLYIKAPVLLTTYFKDTITHQLALQEFIQLALEEDDAVFAFEGIGLFRPSTYHWRTSGVLRDYEQRYSVKEEMLKVRPDLVVHSYRIPNWLSPQDKEFVDSTYLEISPSLYVPGFTMSNEGVEKIGLLISNSKYEITNNKELSCYLNSEKYNHGEVLNLTYGQYILFSSVGECSIKKYIPPNLMKIIKPFNWYQKSYLLMPLAY